MVTLPIVLLIFISSNHQDVEEVALGPTPTQPNIKIFTDASKNTAAAVAVGNTGSSSASVPKVKILADFIGKNAASSGPDSDSGFEIGTSTAKVLEGNNRKRLNVKGSETFDSNASSQVNDLSVSNFKFPDDIPPKSALEGKKIRGNTMTDGKETKEKSPVPLYSLVKNVCGEGYSLDENGVCQKTITVRSGKTFDSERRKRFVPDFGFISQKISKGRLKRDLWVQFQSQPGKNKFAKFSVYCGKMSPKLISKALGCP